VQAGANCKSFGLSKLDSMPSTGAEDGEFSLTFIAGMTDLRATPVIALLLETLYTDSSLAFRASGSEVSKS